MTDIAKTAATQTQVLALELGITESAKKEIIQKHLVAMLAMERERAIPDGWVLMPIEPTLAWFEQAFPTPPRAHERAGAMRVHEHAQKMRMDEYRILISRAPEPEGGEQP